MRSVTVQDDKPSTLTTEAEREAELAGSHPDWPAYAAALLETGGIGPNEVEEFLRERGLLQTAALTDVMIEAGAKAIHDNPPPPQMSAIDWMEMPEHIKELLRYMARVSYLAMESARAKAT
jgi:hypothetical protein